MSKVHLKIRGLDCSEEVNALRREVGPLVGGPENLSFHVLSGKMIVDTGNGIDIETICKAVRRTGMEAVPWEEAASALNPRTLPRLWAEHSRLVVSLFSLAFLVSGFAYHVVLTGFWVAVSESGVVPRGPAILYILSIVAGAWFVAPKALLAARRLRPDMNLLMMVAVMGAGLLGVWQEAAMVSFLFSLALLLESWSVGRARHAVRALLDLSPKTARYVCPHDGNIEEKPVEDILTGWTVVVRPGERIPLDGTVSRGMTSVNQGPITGESVPVFKGVGDEVYAGTINNEGGFEFKVTRAARDTTLAHIIHMIEEAQAHRSGSERWVEKFARYYTPAMLLLAVLIAVTPPVLLGEGWVPWFYNALVILVIACPCALVISTPVSITASLAAAARAGVLIKGGLYVELPSRLRAMAFDKTGTLTYGTPEIKHIIPLNGHTEAELLERAAAVEAMSEHPLAQAILRKAHAEGVDYERGQAFQSVRGKGAQAIVNGRAFWLGSHRYVHEIGMDTDQACEHAKRLEDAGHSVVFIGNESHICGIVSIADEVRERSAAAVRALKAEGLEHLVMLTGDNEGTARAVAETAGMDAYRAELLPQDKVEAVRDLKKKYGAVAVVGDGVNDAPAMAASTLGIAMGVAGTDVAIETADIALMSDDIEKLPWLIRHSRRTMRTVKQNIAVALGLKVVFVGLAMMGLATLWVAIAADMGASLLVIFNGLRLLNARA